MDITVEILGEVCLLELVTIFSPILNRGKNRGNKEKFSPHCDINKVVEPQGTLCYPLIIKLRFPMSGLI